MATYASKSGECFASNNRLARQLGCGIKTVSQGVSKLREEGWIQVTMVYKEDSKEIKNRIVKFPHMTFKKRMTKEEINKRLPDPMDM
jgi:DNA-binding transcriptional regulator YhcF (GntR family)